MRIGFAFSNLVAPIHCQQEEERHPVICCTNGTAASYENFYCRPYKIAQHEPNKKYHSEPHTTKVAGFPPIYLGGTCLLGIQLCLRCRVPKGTAPQQSQSQRGCNHTSVYQSHYAASCMAAVIARRVLNVHEVLR